MTPPRQIYSSTLSRRDRAWVGRRRRPSGVVVPLLARLTAAGVLAAIAALFLPPLLGG